MSVIDFYACLCGKSPSYDCFALSFTASVESLMSVIDFLCMFLRQVAAVRLFFALSFMPVIDFYACSCGKSPP